MDSERETTVNETIDSYLDTEESALWFYSHVRRRIKQSYPDTHLPSTQRQPGNEINSRVTNNNVGLEGNRWRILQASLPCYPSIDH